MRSMLDAELSPLLLLLQALLLAFQVDVEEGPFLMKEGLFGRLMLKIEWHHD